MTEGASYIYNVMSCGLWKACATYQREMNKVFRKQIGNMLEVYMDDMIVKSAEECQRMSYLEVVFARVHQYNMHLNPKNMHFRS
jgi:hypothetical protein